MVTLSKFMHYEIGSQEQLLNFQFRLSVKFILDSFFDKNCTNTTTEIFNPMRVMKILFTNTLEALSYESYEDLIYKYRYTWSFILWELWRSYIQIHLKLYLMRVMKILYTNTLEPLILWDEDLIYKYTWTFKPMRVMLILYTNTLEALILWELWRSYIQIHLNL